MMVSFGVTNLSRENAPESSRQRTENYPELPDKTQFPMKVKMSLVDSCLET